MTEQDWSDLDPSEFTIEELEEELEAVETAGELASIKMTEEDKQDRDGAKEVIVDRKAEIEDEQEEGESEDDDSDEDGQEEGIHPGEDGMVEVDDLRSHPENSEIYGEDMDVSGLVADMQADGFDRANPLTVAPRGVVVKGNRRLLAAEEVGIEEVPVVVKEYDSEAEEVYALVMDNANQRERTPAQKWREAQALEEIESEKAEERMEWASEETPSQNFDEGSEGRSAEVVAEEVGIGSHESYRKLNKVMEAAKEGEEVAQEQVPGLESGEQSIHGAYTTLRDSRKDDEDESPDDTDEDDSDSSEEEQQGTDEESEGDEGDGPPDSVFGDSAGTERDIDTEGTSIGGSSPVEGTPVDGDDFGSSPGNEDGVIDVNGEVESNGFSDLNVDDMTPPGSDARRGKAEKLEEETKSLLSDLEDEEAAALKERSKELLESWLANFHAAASAHSLHCPVCGEKSMEYTCHDLSPEQAYELQRQAYENHMRGEEELSDFEDTDWQGFEGKEQAPSFEEMVRDN